MEIVSATDLKARKCVPCEGGIEACSAEFALGQLRSLPHWTLSEDRKWIVRTLRFSNFLQAVSCINAIAELAEAEQHHPDVHLTGYRNLAIEFTTHAIGGLSENDFIMAAKCDELFEKHFDQPRRNL